MKIKFDITGAPEEPTLVLSTREGKKLGQIAAKEISMGDYLNEASVLQFKVYKFIDGVEDPLWDQLTNFKLVWCQDWDMWFQMVLDVEETTETVKSCECTKLGEAELSQIMLYNIEINTENDILRDDYTEPTIFYDPEDPSRSLLNRMMEKAPHYTIAHVDSTLANIQRTFTFDSESIYDSFQDVAEEIGCLFVFDSNSDEDGNIARTISVYDLESNCLDCGYRGEFTGVCPECGSTNIDEGYGEDTTIFVTADELSDDILFTTDTDSVKNCFRLEAGDDLTTATVRNCNPNGSQYIYYFSDDTKAEMPEELVEKIDSYDELYNYYQNEYVVGFEDVDKEAEFESRLKEYNELVVKYQEYNEDLREITLPIVGYPALMNAYYETIDFQIYLQSGLMPTVSMANTDAEKEAAKIKPSAFTGGQDSSGNTRTGVVAVANMTTSTSAATASNAVVNMAKCIVDMRYQVKSISGVDPSDPSKEIPRMENYTTATDGSVTATWTGALNITNYSDETDTFDTATFSLTVNGDYEDYLYQCIQKTINSENTEDMSITNLFAMELEDFKAELKKYCLDSLNMFYDSCEAVLDVLVEQGVANEGSSWGTVETDSDPYTALYCPYRDKQNAITDEISVREEEIAIIDGTYTWEGVLEKEGLQDFLSDARIYIQSILDFETYLGETLWLQFCAYRREDTYSNSNYISDGLNNAELFDRALEFIEVASKELYKSAELQHSIESDLNNLLVMDKFKPLLQHFEVGNWLRVRIDDIVYKLRLIGYELEWDNIENITLEFSDVMKIKTGASDLKSIVDQASKMATSYDAVQHQASQGSSAHDIVTGWSVEGLNVTNTKIIQAAEGQTQYWDEHGMVFRKYDDVTESYADEQMKIVNSTIAITSDNWESVRTAIGRFYYIDPSTGMYKEAYGINAEVLIGKLILGEELGLYNEGGSLTFDENGLTITNGINTFTVSTDTTQPVKPIISITKNSSEEAVLTADAEGNLVLTGSITATSGKIGNWYINSDSISSAQGYGYNTSGNMYIGSDGISIGYNTFYVSSSGALYANNATITGTITAGSGSKIGGWTSTNTQLYAESDGLRTAMQAPSSSITYVFAAGGSSTASNYSAYPFRVSKAGALYATDINVNNSYKLLLNDSNNTTIIKAMEAWSDEWLGSGIDYIIGFPDKSSRGFIFEAWSDGDSTYYSVEKTQNIDFYIDQRVYLVSPDNTLDECGIAYNSNANIGFYDYTFGIWLWRYNTEDGAMYLGPNDSDYAEIHSRGIYSNTTSSSANVHVDGSGSTYQLLRYNSSSQRYKNIQREISESEVDALFNIPVYLYTYKDDYLSSNDERYGKTIPGFIAEKWDELEPIAVDHEDGLAETWNDHIVVPLMFEMIKSNHSKINTVEDRMDALQLEVDQLKEENESLKDQLATLTA